MGGKYPGPACRAVAEAGAARAYLADATPNAARRGHTAPAWARASPAVAESCGTSRKTITAHYHEDPGGEFERPHPSFAEQLRRARERHAPAADGQRLNAG